LFRVWLWRDVFRCQPQDLGKIPLRDALEALTCLEIEAKNAAL